MKLIFDFDKETCGLGIAIYKPWTSRKEWRLSIIILFWEFGIEITT